MTARRILGALLLAGLVASTGACTRINPPPNEPLMQDRERAAMGRAPAEEGVAPGVPPTGPVVTPPKKTRQAADQTAPRPQQPSLP